jgi:hypothetical protein
VCYLYTATLEICSICIGIYIIINCWTKSYSKADTYTNGDIWNWHSEQFLFYYFMINLWTSWVRHFIVCKQLPENFSSKIEIDEINGHQLDGLVAGVLLGHHHVDNVDDVVRRRLQRVSVLQQLGCRWCYYFNDKWTKHGGGKMMQTFSTNVQITYGLPKRRNPNWWYRHTIG